MHVIMLRTGCALIGRICYILVSGEYLDFVLHVMMMTGQILFFFSGEYLDTVSASDKDDPTSDNGRISYQIEGGGEGKFEINRTSGEFYTTDGAVFEYDIKRQYQILVSRLFLTLNAPIATKVVCFSRLLKCLSASMANSVDSDQTAPIGAVCSGFTLFASILNSSVM